MATANPKRTPEETEEELRLEAFLQSKAKEKKAIFETTREVDERLRNIREEEEEERKRLLHLRTDKVEMDQLRRRVTHLEEEKRTAQSELKSVKTESDELKQQVAVLTKREHEKKALAVEHASASEEIEAKLRAEVKVLRTQNEQQNNSLSELNANLQRITSLSRAQQVTIESKELTIKSLEDKITAGQQMAVETQLRQLNELRSLTQETRQLKQTLTTHHKQQHQQQQQLATEELHQGKRYSRCLTTVYM